MKLTTLLPVPRSRKCGSIHPVPHMPSWRSVSLVKHRDNFTLLIFVRLATGCTAEGSKFESHQGQDFSPLHIVRIGFAIFGVNETCPTPPMRKLTCVSIDLFICSLFNGCSQWPRGVRLKLSSLARTQGSCVRIALQAWMSVCVYSVFVLGSGLATC
jgi:hypothetical protein